MMKIGAIGGALQIESNFQLLARAQSLLYERVRHI